MSGTGADLYEKDFVRWAEAQSAALRDAARAGTNLPLDWENLAEEVESLGASERRELRSRLGTILAHLLKLEYSPAKDPRIGWIETIGRERLSIEDLLDTSPSLGGEVGRMLDQLKPRVARLVSGILFGYGETTGTLPPPAYTEEQVLGDWFPETPKPAP